MYIATNEQTIQETVVEALLTAAGSISGVGDSGMDAGTSQKAAPVGSANKRLSGDSGGGVGVGVAPVPSVSQQMAHKIPLTSYLTPVPLISRRLLSYDRDTHLMPSIYAYYKQVSSSSYLL